MKIRRLSIQRFKSLKNASMRNIGDLTILIGGNGSGKSNFLEALTLFFNELDFETTERGIGGLDNYFWFDRNDIHSIEFEFVVEFSKDEIYDMLPEDSKEAYKIGEKGRLTISRAIKGPADSAVWGVTSAKLVTLTKGRLVTSNKSGIVTSSGEEESPTIDETEGEQESPTIDETEGEQESPTIDETAGEQETTSNDVLVALSPSLLQRLKSRFIYIPATRNAVAAFSGLQRRPSVITADIIDALRTLAQSIGEDERMINLLDQVSNISGSVKDVRLVGSEFTIREQGGRMQLPFALSGSGHQELVALVHRLLAEADCFFGIEEPDLHFHPELIRGFLRFLKTISGDKQVFVATHSTAFVDAMELENVWVASKQDGATTFRTMRESSDLKMLLLELGYRPSDLFFPNGIIFVEGTSDKMAYSIWSEKLKFNFPQKAISFISIKGKTKGKYHLRVWTEAVKNTNLPFFMILDKDAESEARELLRSKILVRDENFFTLKKGDLEEYYPDKKLISALTSTYNLQLSKEEEREIVKNPRCENIEKLLASKLHYQPRGGWKTPIAEEVAKSMNIGEIDNEIRTILDRINSELGLKGY